MGNRALSKTTLQIGTGVVWAAVLLGVSFFTEAESGGNLDWELMWVIIGGFIVQTALIEWYTRKIKTGS